MQLISVCSFLGNKKEIPPRKLREVFFFRKRIDKDLSLVNCGLRVRGALWASLYELPTPLYELRRDKTIQQGALRALRFKSGSLSLEGNRGPVSALVCRAAAIKA